ncbi:unnamed protein product [Prorocentrum cordatum]|uniref:PIPK domain-containing protein n=1 Tax=Prorocentrum cordatum TaxID=2364126 RepID=A0ABN9UY23_9DINO|nr:unnamed protein product [Polarella glacialis]
MVDIEMRAGRMVPGARPGDPGAAAAPRQLGEPCARGSAAPCERDDLEWRGQDGQGLRPAPPRAEAPSLAARARPGPGQGGVARWLVGLAACAVVACSLGGSGGGRAGGGGPGGGEGEGPRAAPRPPDAPLGVGESGRPPFGSAVVYGAQEVPGLTEWECACQQDSDPLVRGILERSGKDCPAADGQGLLISSDLEDCRLAMPFVAAAGTGKTCVSRAAVESSCREVLDGWWDVKLGTWRGDAAFEAWKEFGRSADADEVLERFARDVHDLPLLRWAEKRSPDRASFQVEDFLAYVQPRCVEMVLRVFAGGELTQLSGNRLFDTVFEHELPKSASPPNIVDLTYGWLRDDVKANTQISMHSQVTINGKKEKEHYQFKRLRKQFGVPDSFLDEGAAGRSPEAASDVIVTCEPLSDPHAQVRWRSFHVLAQSYFEHMAQNPDSLLPRIYSAWFSESESGLCYAMQSLVPGHFVSDVEWSRGLSSATLFWELKGSTSLKEYFGQQHQYPIFEDADFKRDLVLLLPAQVREELMEQLKADTQWLSRNGFMDYSLQLLRVKVGDADANILNKVCPGAPDANGKMHRAFFQRDGGFSGTAAPWDSCIYLWAIGLGNTLQPYSLYEAFLAAMNRVVHPGLALTDVDPEKYSESLQAFMLEHSKSEIELPPGVDADVAPRKYQAAFIYQKCSEAQDSARASTPHPPPVCEDVGLVDVVPELQGLLEEASRDFTEDEARAARAQLGVDGAPCAEGAAAASLVVGPAADGDPAGPLCLRPRGAPPTLWMAHHRGYQELVRFGQRLGCVSRSGWEAVTAAAAEQERSGCSRRPPARPAGRPSPSAAPAPRTGSARSGSGCSGGGATWCPWRAGPARCGRRQTAQANTWTRAVLPCPWPPWSR